MDLWAVADGCAFAALAQSLVLVLAGLTAREWAAPARQVVRRWRGDRPQWHRAR
jgi:hypothetical protein